MTLAVDWMINTNTHRKIVKSQVKPQTTTALTCTPFLVLHSKRETGIKLGGD